MNSDDSIKKIMQKAGISLLVGWAGFVPVITVLILKYGFASQQTLFVVPIVVMWTILTGYYLKVLR